MSNTRHRLPSSLSDNAFAVLARYVERKEARQESCDRENSTNQALAQQTSISQKVGHRIWDLRKAEDSKGGYVLVRKEEERAPDMRQTIFGEDPQLKLGSKVAAIHKGQLMGGTLVKIVPANENVLVSFVDGSEAEIPLSQLFEGQGQSQEQVSAQPEIVNDVMAEPDMPEVEQEESVGQDNLGQVSDMIELLMDPYSPVLEQIPDVVEECTCEEEPVDNDFAQEPEQESEPEQAEPDENEQESDPEQESEELSMKEKQAVLRFFRKAEDEDGNWIDNGPSVPYESMRPIHPEETMRTPVPARKPYKAPISREPSGLMGHEKGFGDLPGGLGITVNPLPGDKIPRKNVDYLEKMMPERLREIKSIPGVKTDPTLRAVPSRGQSHSQETISQRTPSPAKSRVSPDLEDTALSRTTYRPK